MKLTTGVPAPVFAVQDIFGQSVALQNFAGKLTLLSFYRNSACALCNLQVHKLIARYPDYHARGLEMLAVFESPLEGVRANVGKQDAPFSIIADPSAALYDLYGVETSEAKVMANFNTPKQQQLAQEAAAIGYPLVREEGQNFYRLPADFLIAPDLTILRAFYSDVVGDHLAFDDIDQALQDAALTPTH